MLYALPFLAMWTVVIYSGIVADLLRTKGILRTTAVGKWCTTIGFVGAGACLVAAGYQYVECCSCQHSQAAMNVIIIAVGLSGISMAGWGFNHFDLATTYAGTLMGIIVR